MTDTTADPQAYDGCRRACRQAGAHTLISGECEHATEPEPTVSLSRVYTATDGHPAIGFDVYTEEQVADLIQPAVGSAAVARAAAHAIMHRHDEPKPAPAVPSAPADRAAVLRGAANGLAALGPLDSMVSAPAAWTEAIETVRRMADQIAEEELRRMADEAQQPEAECAHDADRHGPESGCIECRCTSTDGHEARQADTAGEA